VSLAVIAGSGLGELSRVIEVERETAFDEIPGVGATTIAGHAGRIVSGAIDGRPCQLVLGRRHFYEGDLRPIEHLIDHIASQGATTLLVTSAVGSLRRWLRTGELVVIHDIIDEQNRDGARARAGGDGQGSRWRRAKRGPSGWTEPGPASGCGHGIHVDPVATRLFEQAATEARVAWQPGTMFCASGPLYETRAEVAFQQQAGADVAAMSGAPEVTCANRLGIPAVSVAVVTNPCTGINCAVPSHGEVLEASARAAVDLARVVKQFIVKL
jgi:purine-nucleoside phosphorylase